MFSYPERTCSGTFELFIPGPYYSGSANIAWSPQDLLEFTFDAGSVAENGKKLWLNSQLLTPFDRWRKNAFNYGFYRNNFNLRLANASILWANDQKIALNFKNDYEFGDPHLRYEFRFSVDSTVKEIPSANLLFHHRHSQRHFHTDIDLKHATLNETPTLFAINSKWNVSSDIEFRNLSSTVVLKSSFEGYRAGVFVTRFSLSNKKSIYGTADLHVDEKKYTLRTEGRIVNILDNMLVVNITTPIEKFQEIICRFGLSEPSRHLLASFNTPSSSLGIEIKFDVKSSSDFDVKFNLETPFDRFKKIMLIAKLKPGSVDFQGAWDKFAGGYVSVHRMVSIRDFEYGWKIYTPLEKYKETSLVAKYVHRQKFDLDFELMLQISRNKVGIMLNSKPKPKVINVLRLQRLANFQRELGEDEDDIYLKHLLKVKQRFQSSEEDNEDIDDVDEEDDNDYEDEDIQNGKVVSFTSNLELNTIVWKSITGLLDLDVINENYIVFGNFTIPQGNVEIRNSFYFPDAMNVRNFGVLKTPFNVAKQIKLLHVHSVEPGYFLISAQEVSYLNTTNWNSLGYRLNHTYYKEDLNKFEMIDLGFVTPFDFAPKFQLTGNLDSYQSVVEQQKKTSYEANLLAKSSASTVLLKGSAEVSGSDLDVRAQLDLNAPSVPNYSITVNCKKEMSIVGNSIKFGVTKTEDGEQLQFNSEANWHQDGDNYFRGSGKVQTNVFPIQTADILVYWQKGAHFEGEVGFWYTNMARTRTDFSVKTKKQQQQITVELITPIRDYTNVTIDVSLLPTSNPDRFNIVGQMFRPSDTYNVNGYLVCARSIPTELNLQLKGQRTNLNGNIVYSLKGDDVDKHIKYRIEDDRTFLEGTCSLTMFNKLDWTIASTFKATPGLMSYKMDANECSLKASVKSLSGEHPLLAVVNFTSPWRHLGVDAVNIQNEILLQPNAGTMKLIYDLSLVQGHSICSWSLDFLENFKVLLNNRMQKTEYEEKTLQIGAQYTNPGNKLEDVTFGGILAINSKWNFEANGTLKKLNINDVTAGLTLHLPESNDESHDFKVRYFSDMESFAAISNTRNLDYELKYTSQKSQKLFSTQGRFHNETDFETLVRIDWGSVTKANVIETNLNVLRKDLKREILARVKTPYFNEDSVVVKGTYDRRDIYHLLA